MQLKDYPTGTLVEIDGRKFEKTTPGTFWREVHSIPGNCVSRPSVSLEVIEDCAGVKHVVVQ